MVAELPVPVYRYVGRFFDDTLLLDEETTSSDAERRIVSLATHSRGTCREASADGRGYGLTQLPSRFPVELGAWLALAELERGSKVHSLVQGQSRARASDHAEMSTVVVRDVTRFEPMPGMVCGVQFKRYSEQSRHPPQSAILEQIDEASQTEAEVLQLNWRGRGRFAWEMIGHRGASYRLNINVSQEVEDRSGSGEVLEQTMSCRWNRPVYFDLLAGIEVGYEDQVDGTRHVCVWRAPPVAGP